ncbi:hypothetical protein [Rhodovarius lipocyclicus]|uniref:hypothetical protein n=1 Tax=Rhodovarius lipocyclicus TaxID=268410 RepID=UPI001359C06D|nr:hypothetical protein [Rhodovarius lipocyclicus]
MPKPRLPKAKAEVSAAVLKDPGRHAGRKPPKIDAAIGDPPSWMTPEQAQVWWLFVAEVPWLNHSHRAVIEIAVTIRARLMSGADVGVQALNLLRQCLGQIGATPADASKVNLPDDEDKDPDERFFN